MTVDKKRQVNGLNIFFTSKQKETECHKIWEKKYNIYKKNNVKMCENNSQSFDIKIAGII